MATLHSSSIQDAMGSQNLASVLNDPTISRSQSESIFTKDWGSYFIETPVADASVSVSANQLDFMKRYMKDVRRRAKMHKRLAADSQTSVCSSHRVNSLSQVSNRQVIPDLFLQSGLDFTREDIFLQILKYGSTDRAVSPVTDESLSPIVVKEAQKNLSDILDVVEDQLSIQIGSKFREFFQIMTTMNTLMDQVSKTIKEVSSVRGKCDFLRESIIKPIMTNILLMKRKENLNAYLRTLHLMDSIFNSTSRASMLLSSKDYVGALDLTSSAREGIVQKLPTVKCLNHLTAELEEKERLIEKLLDEDLNKLLTNELIQPMEPGTVLTPSKVARESVNVMDEDALFAVIFGMLKIQQFAFVEKFYEQAKTAIIAILKQTIILALAGAELDVINRSEDHLYNQLRQVDLKRWLNALDCTFASVIILLKRIRAVNQIILKTIAVAADKGWSNSDESDDSTGQCVQYLTTPKGNLSEQQYCEWTKSTKDCLISLCNFSQNRFTDMIDKRLSSENCTDRFTSSEFIHLAQSIIDFSCVCESISGYKSNKLLKLLQLQATKFAHKYHEEKKKKLDSLLDIEQWKSLESIPRDFIIIVHQLTVDNVRSAMNNGLQSFDTRHASNRTDDNDTTSDTTNDTTNDTTSTGVVSDESDRAHSTVTVEKEEFRLVSSVVLLITLLFEYSSLANELHVLSPDLFRRLLELVTFFNEKTFSLVYNGAAKQVAGLKSITSRTLVNAARALSFVLKILPHIKGRFINILTLNCNESDSNSSQFDLIISKYEEHVEKLYDKVVSSNRDFIAARLSKWEGKPPVPSPVFQAITQHLGSLHAILEESLPPHKLRELFSRIDHSFKEALRYQLNKLNIVRDGGPQHG